MFSGKYKKEIEELKESLKKEREEKEIILNKNKELEGNCTLLQKQNNTLTNNLEASKNKVVETYKSTEYRGTATEIVAMLKELIGEDKQFMKMIDQVDSVGLDIKNIMTTTGETVQAVATHGQDTSGLVNEFAASFEELLNKVKSIENISSQINGIASQTQLLSLNASIESARAGEAGRGFTIVADEIKKLSENTTALLGDIQKTVKETYNIAVRAKNQATDLSQGKDQTIVVVREAQAGFEKVNNKMAEIGKSIEKLNHTITGHLELGDSIIQKVNTIK